jgi:hypothetical protein
MANRIKFAPLRIDSSDANEITSKEIIHGELIIDQNTYDIGILDPVTNDFRFENKIATSDKLGRVKVGSGLNITSDGTLSLVAATSDDTSTDSELFPTFVNTSSGTLTSIRVSSNKLTYNPSSGTLTAISFNSTSDERLKENIEPLTYGLECLNKIEPKMYNFIDDKSKKTYYGVIAQEVEKVLPDLVTTKDNGYLSVNYLDMIAILIKSVQELSSEVTELKKLINN